MACDEPRGRPKLDPVAEFIRDEAFGGFALLIGALAALIWVNALSASGYESLWTTELRIGVGKTSITEDLRHWVNDGLMVLFFFLISLEIKRELVTGDLRDRKTAALPVLAALGGVLVPIAIFLALAGGGEGAEGWGIPMATDAAFAIGVLASCGDRVGIGVKLFLVTVAVVDDVAAISVIAIAYTEDLARVARGRRRRPGRRSRDAQGLNGTPLDLRRRGPSSGSACSSRGCTDHRRRRPRPAHPGTSSPRTRGPE